MPRTYRKPFHVAVWEERDRLHVDLQDADDATIVEWWDDEARDAFEDGYLRRAKLLASATEYAYENGILTPNNVVDDDDEDDDDDDEDEDDDDDIEYDDDDDDDGEG